MSIVGQSYRENPYLRWIETYSGENFGCSVSEVINIFDDVALKITEEMRNKMVASSYKSTVLGWHFWSDAYRRTIFGWVFVFFSLFREMPMKSFSSIHSKCVFVDDSNFGSVLDSVK
ncbi:hypothetical protein [Pajaroellobacter abortibovis]|uniref:Thiaminase-2/PQQC domain-containing protein n=1 Tax=Pajaroellobacter abortibovis TaxID=1882918 RepID=A0A1L6MWC8_9BACT|nr:hypothetical protein BCY86_02830 [Pajaroellobacter abortibovis]